VGWLVSDGLLFCFLDSELQFFNHLLETFYLHSSFFTWLASCRRHGGGLTCEIVQRELSLLLGDKASGQGHKVTGCAGLMTDGLVIVDDCHKAMEILSIL
jgi:hypothetical protein